MMEHDLLTNRLEELKDALLKPAIIKTSMKDDRVRYYYRWNKHLKLFLMVVVKYLNGHGFVITAYFTKSP